ncbi:MAG: nucleoside kinase [Anaerolineae bacterium]
MTRQSTTTVSATLPRSDAQITFTDGRCFNAPLGTPLIEYMRAAFPADHPDQPILAGVVGESRLVELRYPVTADLRVRPITLRDSDGGRIYRRSLVLVLTVAVSECFPQTKVAVKHSIPSGGYYCETVGRPNFSSEELAQLKARMLEIVEADEPITRTEMPLDEAKAWFVAHQDESMLRLLNNRAKPYLTVYQLRGVLDYFFGYMTPSTGVLRVFDLIPSEDGFVLRYPLADHPHELMPYTPSIKLERVFQQHKLWQQRMGLDDIGTLNQSLEEGRFREEVLIAEALHARYLDTIAEEIANRHRQGMRLVLIAGPSSSGKTTFSKRLAVHLMAYGIQPFTLAMDNFFVDRALTPRDENGNYDFESLYALNLPRLNADVKRLISGAEVHLPKFNFLNGRSEHGETTRLPNDAVIIAEGIHGLNPNLLPEIDVSRVYRIYVSALTSLNLDSHNRVPTTDVRLLRRIVRDAAHRGYSAQDTLSRWASVRRGEKRNIFPFQENADAIFNSSLPYELAVLKPVAEPLLRRIDPDSPLYIEAKRLLSFLEWVTPAEAKFVPDNSLIREFIGGSILEDYTPTHRIK